MNPKSSYHLAFNMGYPNAYDRAHGRTGSQPDGAWRLLVVGLLFDDRRADRGDLRLRPRRLPGGQTEFQIQAFPFRMTAANMARYRNDPNYEFWTMLKEGYDHFEITKVPPKVDVCEKRYVFNRIPEGDAAFSPTGACPPSTQPGSLVTAYQSYQKSYEAAFATAANKGADVPPQSRRSPGSRKPSSSPTGRKKRARGERVPVEPPSLNTDGTVTADRAHGPHRFAGRKQQAALDAAAAEEGKGCRREEGR